MNVVSMPPGAAARADAEQRAASDPRVSAFVSASAGSGKTKLLTDRLLRLMLDGAEPGRIQCLTFTKAAAAEMAVRLQARLGGWVTMTDAALSEALAELDLPADERRLGLARSLFATVLDLPGGMRIGTIHGFCESLLRRFPLEAGVSPHARVLEEGEARRLRDQVREEVVTAVALDSLSVLAEAEKADAFEELLVELGAARERMQGVLRLLPAQRRAALRRALAVEAESEAAVLRRAVTWPGEADIAETVRVMAAHATTPPVRQHAAAMAGWLAQTPAARAAAWDQWVGYLLTQKQTPFAAKTFASKPVQERYPELMQVIGAEQERVMAVLDQRRAARLVDTSAALLDLAVPVLQRYEQRKREMGLLDFSDMIAHAARLLRDPGAAWVLYKLDGGLDHLLLDEVQDTSPEQWRLAHALTEEFFAGLGRDQPRARTFFAVGDPKQSIYSFQGADPEEFDRSHAQMRERVRAAGQTWRDVRLDVSFRSTAPVLDLVDAVFADPLAAHGVTAPGLRHVTNRAGDAGRVELWPLPPPPPGHTPAPWTVAARNADQPTREQALATEVARWIERQLSEGVLLPSQGRALQPGDILILVQYRSKIAPALVRALKLAGVPVAGIDRLELRAQLAVQDLLALCDALLLPGDDLQVACVLTSPLGGLSDDSLMELAIGRDGSLWEALRLRAGEREVWREALDFLDTLHARADFVTPHALLSEALGPLGGRARLLRRLGAEAAEPIDELLNAALAYGAAYPPSLQGFTHWMRNSAAEIKRAPEGFGGLVRVMTAHGAKGLQARLVILPDTIEKAPPTERITWLRDPAGGWVPVWTPRVAMGCALTRAACAREAEAARAESNRLLYVALTRAQDQLVICGWGSSKPPKPESWYALVRRGMERAGARAAPFTSLAGDWTGERLVLAAEQRAPVPAATRQGREDAAPLPAWAGRPPEWRPVPLVPEPLPPMPLAPSRPEGVEWGPVPRAGSPLDSRQRADPFLHGRIVHALLQYLPDIPDAGRADAALAYAGRPGFGLSQVAARRLAEEVVAVLENPRLALLFGPASRAEQPLAGVVGGVVISGVVDRIAVLPDAVLVADFKTGMPPARVEDTPPRYLAQLAAYRAVLEAAFPGRNVRCILVWTGTAQAAVIPEALLAAHQPGARAA